MLNAQGGTAVTFVLRGVQLLTVSALLLIPSHVLAQQSKSAALATELARLLDEQKLDSIAARRTAADEFVGALYFPGSQLLVVNAKFSAPDRITYHLLQKNYKDAYIELNGTTEKQSKVFISDLGANGLAFRRQRNQPFDTVELLGKTVSFDGEWRKAKISEEDYTKTFQSTDDQYAEMLQVLIAALKKTS
jgi:hypothetical protein